MKKLLVFLVLCSTTLSFAQEITGRTRTNDKYSNAIRAINEGYFKNDLSSLGNTLADNGAFSINGESYSKAEIMGGFAMHHKIYSNIKMPMHFIDTTFYDENNNNQVWSHLWGLWEATAKRTGKKVTNPVNISFKWADGKVVNASWIYNPTQLNEEIAAMQ